MEKISYECGTASEPLLGVTIGDAFDNIVNRYPTNEAIVVRHQDIRMNYLQLQREIDICARAFLALKVQKGDRVGIWSPNCFEWLVTQIATAKIGAILVNINPSYRLNELEYALTQSGCSIIVIAERFKSSDYVSMIRKLIPETLQEWQEDLKCESFPILRYVIYLGTSLEKGLLPWKQFLSLSTGISPDKLLNVQRQLSFDDAINIQYTSGTTGYPKGATLSHHNILNNGYLVAKTMRFTEKDRLVVPVPLYHCFGMVMGNLGCITHGATIIYPSDSFDAESVLKSVEQEGATALFGVPTMFKAELDHPNFKSYNLSSLRTGIMAGSLCPADLMKKVNNEMHLPEMEIAYGMTETSPVSTQTRHDAPFEKRVSTVGKVMPHTEIKIIDPETKLTVPVGSPGELCTRGYCVMLGYWDNPEQTCEAIDQARWMHTGDIAILDDEGYINIVGRIKDMIIRGGENIYPKEIEEFLSKNPKIKEVQVVGIPDEKYGEEVCAWIQLADGQMASEGEIKEYCHGKISHFKIPRYIRFVSDFPMTVTGKIRKVEMKEITMKELSM